MIVAAGLSPAWQHILVLDELIAGKVQRVREAHWCASGKVLNVGIALHHLGAESTTVALLGGPPLECVDREFAGFGANASWVISRATTRVCTTLLDRATGLATELVENAPAAAPQDLADFRRVFAETASRSDWVVVSGSLPPGTPKGMVADLIGATRAHAILDVRGEELVLALERRPFLVKPNAEELGQTVGRSVRTQDDLLGAMRELNRRGATWVVVTQGAGLIWATSEEGQLRVKPPPVEDPVNPIGCGDCFAAGLAWSLDEGRELPDALRLAVASAGENLRQLLPGRLDVSLVRARAERVVVDWVSV